MKAMVSLVSCRSIVGRSAGIDLLRFGFAFWVILAHLIPWTVAVQGPEAMPSFMTASSTLLIKIFQSNGELHPAVVGFIVLSGYCVHRNGLRNNPGELRAYLRRRVLRIMPVFLLAAIAGVAVLPFLTAQNPQLTQVLNGIIKANPICFLARITTLASFTSYFDPCAYSGNAPLSTVMVEIDLYIFYGVFFLIFGWRGREASGLLLIAATSLLSLIIISLSTYGYQRWFQQNSFISFLPYWWMGAAVLDQSVATKLRRSVPAIIVVWLFLSVLVAFFGAGAVAGEMKKLCYALLVAALIVKIDSASIGDNPLSALGRAGYSLYAFHSPIFCLGLIYGWSAVIVFMLAIGVGILSYALIEKPSMRINAALSPRISLDRP